MRKVGALQLNVVVLSIFGPQSSAWEFQLHSAGLTFELKWAAFASYVFSSGLAVKKNNSMPGYKSSVYLL